jgi:hypothetical protein
VDVGRIAVHEITRLSRVHDRLVVAVQEVGVLDARVIPE